MTYLIPCSSSKKVPVDIQHGSLDDLYMSELLGPHRNELIARRGIPLTWCRTMPAYQLYSGSRSVIYSRISYENWMKPCVQVLILSALFGWVRHTDRLPYYDLKMNGKQGLPMSPEKFWRDKVDLVGLLGHHDYVDLLSKNYKKALRAADMGDRPLEYIGRGQNIGDYLETQLTQLNCHERNHQLRQDLL